MRLPLPLKLSAGFGTILIMTGIVGVIAYSSMAAGNDMLRSFASGPFENSQRAAVIRSQILDLRRTVLATIVSDGGATLGEARKAYTSDWTAITTNMDALLASMDSTTRGQYSDLRPALEELRRVSDETFEAHASAARTATLGVIVLSSDKEIATADGQLKAAHTAIRAELKALAAVPGLAGVEDAFERLSA